MDLIKSLVRMLVSHDMASKEAIRSLLGWFLYLPFVVAPILAVVVLLFALRRMTARAVRIMNLVLASGCVLLWVALLSGCPRAGSSPTISSSASVKVAVISFVAGTWLAGAIGLFFRKRLAWVASVIGAIALAVGFMAGLVTVGVILLYPDEAMTRNREIGGAGYAFAGAFLLTQCSISLAVFLRLLLGLFQMRKEVFGTA